MAEVNHAFFMDYLLRYRPVNLRQLEQAPPTVDDHYVLMAKVTNVYTSNAAGIDVKVRDHTGASDFAIRGVAARDFHDLHLPAHNPNDPVANRFRLRTGWFKTYIFKIHREIRRANNGRCGIVVSRFCWNSDIIDVFARYRIPYEEYRLYRLAIETMVPSGDGYHGEGLDISPNRAGCVGNGVGFRKRVYGPFLG